MTSLTENTEKAFEKAYYEALFYFKGFILKRLFARQNVNGNKFENVNKSQKSYKLCIKCNFIFTSQYDEYCSFLMKNADVSRAQVVLYVIYIFFEFSFVKI